MNPIDACTPEALLAGGRALRKRLLQRSATIELAAQASVALGSR